MLASAQRHDEACGYAPSSITILSAGNRNAKCVELSLFANNFATIVRAHGTPGGQVDGVGNEPHGAVSHASIDGTCMDAAGSSVGVLLVAVERTPVGTTKAHTRRPVVASRGIKTRTPDAVSGRGIGRVVRREKCTAHVGQRH